MPYSNTEIDEQATALLKAVFGSLDAVLFPIDLNQITQYCGLSVMQGTFKEPGLEGVLDRQKQTIYLAENAALPYQNFTAAHELGHFKLHADKKVDTFSMHDLNSLMQRAAKGGEEAEADRFAASLLMPEKSFRAIWEATKDLEKISNIFGVPMVVVLYRLQSLHLY